jgi:hypothetical protein
VSSRTATVSISRSSFVRVMRPTNDCGLFVVEVGDDDVGTFGREASCGDQPDAGGTADDHRYAALMCAQSGMFS